MKRVLRTLGWIALLIILVPIGIGVSENLGVDSSLGGSVGFAIWLCLILWMTRDSAKAFSPLPAEDSAVPEEDKEPSPTPEPETVEAKPIEKPRIRVHPLVVAAPSEDPEPELDAKPEPELEPQPPHQPEPKSSTDKTWTYAIAGLAAFVALAMLLSSVEENGSSTYTSEQQKRISSAEPSTKPKESTETLVAKWEVDLGPGFRQTEENLVHQDGKMVLRRKYSDGSWGSQELIERPAKNSGERRFATEEGPWSEYFTLSNAGQVKHFSWDGAQFATGTVTFAVSNAMGVGRNVQVRECSSRSLSDAATQFIQLHKELHAFKDDPQFAIVGFAVGHPYNNWLKSAESLQNMPQPVQLAFMREVGFYLGDLWNLGWTYMATATGNAISQQDVDYIAGMERTIRVGISIAKCET